MNRSITERSTVSGDRAPGPDPAHQRADLAIGLAPYLWTSGPLVGSGVLGVRVLVGVEGAGDLAGQPAGDPVIRVGMVGQEVGGGDDDVGSVGAKKILFLDGNLVGNHTDDPIATNGSHHCQPDSGVAGGRFDDGAARPA